MPRRSDRLIRPFAAVLAAAALLAAGALRLAPAAAAPQTHSVELWSNFYSPRVINISPGDTVAWTAMENGHTVEADDGRFNFYPQRFIDRGETVRFTFLRDETVKFHCRVHGAVGGGGMAGTIVVGAGSPNPNPTPTPPVIEHRSVPSSYATIASALDGISPGGVVHLAPGIYHESVAVRTPGVTIAGEAPGVVIDGQSARATGVLLAASGAALRDVAVIDHRAEGVAVRGATGVSVSGVTADGNGDYGILVADAAGVTVSSVTARGHRVAGIAVKGCDECDTIVQDSAASDNLYGVLIDDAGGVIVRRNTVHDNATGVVARAFPGADGALLRGVHVWGNDIASNTAAKSAAAATEFSVRSGVWLAGSWFAVVEDNTIDGHDYGVLVTAFGAPTLDGRIAANTIGGSAVADLAWDGLGARVCFERNHRPGGADPGSSPPLAQTLYACDGGIPAGVPEPTVIAALARYAAGA